MYKFYYYVVAVLEDVLSSRRAAGIETLLALLPSEVTCTIRIQKHLQRRLQAGLSHGCYIELSVPWQSK